MPSATAELLAGIARELQAVPAVSADAPLLAAAVIANNQLIADAARTLLRMEDHPGTFDPWGRTFTTGDAR